MQHESPAIPDDQVPSAADATFDHLVLTYASEANKLVSLWRAVPNRLLDYRPHEKVNDVRTIMVHQLLSERRFFAEFIGTDELPVDTLLPPDPSPGTAAYIEKYLAQVRHRLPQIAAATREWWMTPVPFFGEPRQRIWTFWRRVLHTAHHRTQLQLYLRLAGEHVPAIYGPSGDVRWEGADPTYSIEAAKRA